jgi:hypothetical protein
MIQRGLKAYSRDAQNGGGSAKSKVLTLRNGASAGPIRAPDKTAEPSRADDHEDPVASR